MGHLMIKGYKIFDNIEKFYNWQGKNGSPAVGTVNYILGFSTNNSQGTFRYTYPNPHSTASFDVDKYGMPENISGNDLRVCCEIDHRCPKNKIPDGLETLEQVKEKGFYLIEEAIDDNFKDTKG
jgi:hypothetical protein